MKTEDLFDPDSGTASSPLPNRMRPKKWEEFVGQENLVKLIKSRKQHSMILYGPPGCGKTTLARLLCREGELPFYSLSAVSSGVKEVREIIALGKERSLQYGRGVVLFIDEIHRFSKSQQDALLGAVEAGQIVLIGATTENPSFEVIGPLLSRCRVYRLSPHSKSELDTILDRAFKTEPLLSGVAIAPDARKILIDISAGDARKMLGLLEAALPDRTSLTEETIIDTARLESAIQNNLRVYDKNGEYHYDFISAFIKSLRGSDPDAALLYMAAMLDAGEDPLFIARRMVIFASEDVGNASPQALGITLSAYQALERIGMPEGRIILGQAVTFLAASPKSNASYLAVNSAIESVRGKMIQIPMHLRNAPTKLHKIEGASAGYKYPHDYPNHYVKENYMPQGFEKTQFYFPENQGQEERIRERLQNLRPERSYNSQK